MCCFRFSLEFTQKHVNIQFVTGVRNSAVSVSEMRENLPEPQEF